MTGNDDRDTIEALQNCLHDAKHDAQAADSKLTDEAPYLPEHTDEIRSAAQEIRRFAEDIEMAADTLQRGEEVFGDASQSVASTIQILQHMEDVVEDLEAEDTDATEGTLTLDGVEYNVTVEKVGPDNGEDAFGGWLDHTMQENDLAPANVAEHTLVSEDRVAEIIDGDTPTGDEGPSIIKYLYNADYITEDTAATVKEMYGLQSTGGTPLDGVGD